jgi:uncharacterized protein YecE (DUF72 family)
MSSNSIRIRAIGKDYHTLAFAGTDKENRRMPTKPDIRIGTSAFTAAGWPGSFYPEGMKPAEYLSHYATKFDTVEIDSTFYRTPAVSVVKGWAVKTPKDFVFALKVPQVITHEKVCVNCDDDLKHFLTAVNNLGDKLGVLLFQFGYFNKTLFKTQADFIAVLEPLLKSLPKGYKFALEIRNKSWMDARFMDLLRKYKVGFALIDQSWVPRPWEFKMPLETNTAEFAYIRLLGDRKGIEAQTKTWNKVIVDRNADLKKWAGEIDSIQKLKIPIYTYVNNHYAGCAPETVRAFQKMLRLD